MDNDSRKRNLSEISEASNPSPVNEPKRLQTEKSEHQDIPIPSNLDINMALPKSPIARLVQLDSKISNLSKKSEEISTLEESRDDSYTQLDNKVSHLSEKVDEVLRLLKSENVTANLDIKSLQTENKQLKLQVKECEGAMVKLNSTVSALESQVEALQIYSMKSNLVIHNLPEQEGEDCYSKVTTFMQKDLRIPETHIFSATNPLGDIRIDVAHRIGQRNAKARSMLVKFMSHCGRDMVLSFSKNLRQSPLAISEHLPPMVKEKRAAQVPLLKKLREEAKTQRTDRRVKLVADKLMVNSTVNMEAFEKNRLDTSLSVSEPISLENMVHSNKVALKGSIFQGHLYQIHTEGEAIQALRAISQDEHLVRSDHIMYAYNFTDAEGQTKSGYFDDKEWRGSSVLASLLEQKSATDVILIVTRKFGGTHLGKKRFELIKEVALEVIDEYIN